MIIIHNREMESIYDKINTFSLWTSMSDILWVRGQILPYVNLKLWVAYLKSISAVYFYMQHMLKHSTVSDNEMLLFVGVVIPTTSTLGPGFLLKTKSNFKATSTQKSWICTQVHTVCTKLPTSLLHFIHCCSVWHFQSKFMPNWILDKAYWLLGT